MTLPASSPPRLNGFRFGGLLFSFKEERVWISARSSTTWWAWISTAAPSRPRPASGRIGRWAFFSGCGSASPAATGAYDAGALLEQENGRDILFHQDVPESPDGQQHFWGKPLWGYYDSADEWVIRRQIELLMLAGVDFIVFDTTNARTYPQVYEQVLAVIQAYQQAGWNPPAPPFIPTLILWIPCGFCMRSCIGRVNSPPPGTSWTASR